MNSSKKLVLYVLLAATLTALGTYLVVTKCCHTCPNKNKRMLTTIRFDTTLNFQKDSIHVYNQHLLASWVDHRGAGWVTVDPVSGDSKVLALYQPPGALFIGKQYPVIYIDALGPHNIPPPAPPTPGAPALHIVVVGSDGIPVLVPNTPYLVPPGPYTLVPSYGDFIPGQKLYGSPFESILPDPSAPMPPWTWNCSANPTGSNPSGITIIVTVM